MNLKASGQILRCSFIICNAVFVYDRTCTGNALNISCRMFFARKVIAGWVFLCGHSVFCSSAELRTFAKFPRKLIFDDHLLWFVFGQKALDNSRKVFYGWSSFHKIFVFLSWSSKLLESTSKSECPSSSIPISKSVTWLLLLIVFFSSSSSLPLYFFFIRWIIFRQ